MDQVERLDGGAVVRPVASVWQRGAVDIRDGRGSYFFHGAGRGGERQGKKSTGRGGAGNPPFPTMRGGAGKGSKSAGWGGAGAGNMLRVSAD